MIKPERNKRSLRFFNSCWRFLAHLKTKNKNKPEPEAEVENVCGSKENIHRGQGEPLLQEVVELPVCDDSFVTCVETFVTNDELTIPEECDTVEKEASPERVVEVDKVVLTEESLKKTESSSSDDQFFYQPVSKRREVIEKRILSLKGDTTNVERILKHAEDEIKKRQNDSAKWKEKDGQLIAPHPSVDCMPNDSKQFGNGEETPETPMIMKPPVVEAFGVDNKCEDSLVSDNTTSSKDICENCPVVQKPEVISNDEELCEVSLDEPSVSTKNDNDTDVKTINSPKSNNAQSSISEPRKCISESLVNKVNVEKENDSSKAIPYPDVIENALENTEYMDEELQETGIEMNQYENNFDDSSDGAQSQTYFSGEISSTPVTEKSYDDQPISVQPLGRFAGLGDHNFEQMINNSITIFSVLEERMCQNSSEIAASEENVEILPIESETNANDVWEGDLTTPSVPMFQYPEENEGLRNELIKNNTPEPLEYFEFNSSQTSFQQELTTETEEVENNEKSENAPIDDGNNSQQVSDSTDLNVNSNETDNTGVTQNDETSNICEVTIKETVEETIEATVSLDVEETTVDHVINDDYYKYPSDETSPNFSPENIQVVDNEQELELHHIDYDVPFKEQTVFTVTTEIEYHADSLDTFGITEKELEESMETPIFPLEFDVPQPDLNIDYMKTNDQPYFEYDPFMNSPDFKPEISVESDQLGECEQQTEESILGVNYNGQFQENTDFSMPDEAECVETLDPYEPAAVEPNDENTERPIFHLKFDFNRAKPAEPYFDYDPYQASDNFKHDIIAERNSIDYVMGIGDNAQFQEQNSFNIPMEIRNSSSKENVFEINGRKSFEQDIAAQYYQVEYEHNDLPKDPVEQYFEYDPYRTSTFKPEIIGGNNSIYPLEASQFDDGLNIANRPEDSVNANLTAYQLTDEETFEKNVENLVYEHTVDREDFVPTDVAHPSEQYYQYDPFQSSVKFSTEMHVECVDNEDQPDRTLDLGHNMHIQGSFDYVEPTNTEDSRIDNFGFYSTGIDDSIDVQKFNYECETNDLQRDFLKSNCQKPFEQYSEYDPFRSSINLGPEIFVESSQPCCQSPMEKDIQFLHNEMNSINCTDISLNVEHSDICDEIDEPTLESNANKYEECPFNMEDYDTKSEKYCHMEYENGHDTNAGQYLPKPKEADNNEYVQKSVESPVHSEECKECLPISIENSPENAKENPKDWCKSESDFSWDFESQDKIVDSSQPKESNDTNIKEETVQIAVPDESVKEGPQMSPIIETHTSIIQVPDDDESQKSKEADNIETESHHDIVDNCEAQNEPNTMEEPAQNDETQKMRKRRNRKKKGKRTEEEDKPKAEAENVPQLEEKAEKEVIEQKEIQQENLEPEESAPDVNCIEGQVTTNKRNRRKKKQNNLEELPQVEIALLVEETTQEEVKNIPPPEPIPEQENSQGTEQETKKRRNRRKRR